VVYTDCDGVVVEGGEREKKKQSEKKNFFVQAMTVVGHTLKWELLVVLF
jgi:hypothetical protein